MTRDSWVCGRCNGEVFGLAPDQHVCVIAEPDDPVPVSADDRAQARPLHCRCGFGFPAQRLGDHWEWPVAWRDDKEPYVAVRTRVRNKGFPTASGVRVHGAIWNQLDAAWARCPRCGRLTPLDR